MVDILPGSVPFINGIRERVGKKTFVPEAGRRIIVRNHTYLKLTGIYKRYKGYVETKELLGEGFSNRQIGVLTEEGYLEKVCHGHYWLTGQCSKPQDYKCIEVCLSNPRAVICMGSAIYYQGGMAEEPEYLSVATERTDRSLLKMNFPVKRHYFSGNNFKVGIRKRDTEFGSYHIYDMERSICDMLRFDPEIKLEILDQVRNNEQRYERMIRYAELFRIKRRI